MSRIIALVAACMGLALSCAVLAEDADPTLQERVGYALSRAQNAAQGDKPELASLQADAAVPDAAAEFGLGEYYVLTKDYPQSITWLRKSAGRGFPGAYYALGKAYDFGLGVPVDYAQAMRFYLKATELPDAEMLIGDLYADGHGVGQDYAQAVSWYRKAAQAGSIRADVTLGRMYEAGLGLKRDDAQALQWYRKAADVGDAQAQYLVGRIYEQPGALQDYKQAGEWYGKASQQGVADAQLGLGALYSSGRGVPADAGKAVQQFQMAANQGQPQAQCRLAESFAAGAGVPADPFRAYEWFTLAGMSRHAQDTVCTAAAERMKDLEQQLGPAQVARARRAAAAWYDSHRAPAPQQ